jgi:hypothetical protein
LLTRPQGRAVDSSSGARRASSFFRPVSFWLPTALALAWLGAVALGSLLPTLLHGTKLGSYDILNVFGLGTVPGGKAPHNSVSSDQIQQFLPWTALVWKDLHSGHLPLWNPYSAFGTPLAFNFQSAPFSLPMLVAYVAPIRFAYTVVIIVKILIAGTGAFVLGRVIGLGTLAAVFAGTIFELSGSFGGWLGWPMAGVMCWLGWVLAATLLVLRGRHRLASMSLLAVTLAFAVYGGHPETLAILAFVAAVVAIVVLAEMARRVGPRQLLRRLGSLILGAVVGLALASPLLLPGLQALQGTSSSSRSGYVTLPAHAAINVGLAGYFGFPTSNSAYFGPYNYYETASYVGPVALILVVLAVLCAWRRPVVRALTIVGILLSLIVFFKPMASVLNSLPGAKLILWDRSLIALDAILAVLAAIGLQCLLDRDHARSVSRRFAAVTALGAVAVTVLIVRQFVVKLPAQDQTIRDRSLVWPTVCMAITVGVAAVLVVVNRSAPCLAHAHRGPSRRLHMNLPMTRNLSALVLLAAETAFLLTAAPHLWSSSTQTFPPTPADLALEAKVGTQRVGFGSCPGPTTLAELGILSDANSAFGVAEMGIDDPVIPAKYVSEYANLTHTAPVSAGDAFCPSLTTAAIARYYGVAVVLEAAGAAAPPGMVAAGMIGDEEAFDVPGGGVVTLQPAGQPAGDPTATSLPVSYADPNALRLVANATRTSTLYLHIGNFPGWTATIDGHSLNLRTWAGSEMAASVPPGHHVIVVRYRPKDFEIGVLLAVIALVGLVAAAVAGVALRRRRGNPAGLADQTGTSTDAMFLVVDA